MSLQVFLQTVNEYCHVVRASSPADLRRQVCIQHPDVALIDWELPRAEMNHLLADLHAICPHLIVINLHPETMKAQFSRCSPHGQEPMPV